MKQRILVVACLVVLTAPAFADRFRVQLGDLPPIVVGDSQSYGRVTTGSGAPRPPRPSDLASIPLPRPNATTTLPDPASAPSRTQIPTAPAPTPRAAMPLQDAVKPGTATPTVEFKRALAERYAVTDAAQVLSAWRFYLREDRSLGEAERIGNGVIQMILALGKAPSAGSTARPEALKPGATRGSVRAADGLSVRAKPWGARSGQTLGAGAAVEIVPPADGCWYRVRTGSGVGWVCGLWLELQQ